VGNGRKDDLQQAHGIRVIVNQQNGRLPLSFYLSHDCGDHLRGNGLDEVAESTFHRVLRADLGERTAYDWHIEGSARQLFLNALHELWRGDDRPGVQLLCEQHNLLRIRNPYDPVAGDVSRQYPDDAGVVVHDQAALLGIGAVLALARLHRAGHERLGPRQRHGEVDRCALARLAFRPNLAPVELDQVLADG